MKRLMAMSICSMLLAGEAGAQMPASAKKAEVDERLLKLYDAREFQGMPYRLMKPVDFAPETSYPLVVSLHGAAGRGNHNLKNVRMPWMSIMARDELGASIRASCWRRRAIGAGLRPTRRSQS